MKNIIVTTSWDDGHVLDLKLAELLLRYRVAGTFYISPEDREISIGDRLAKANIRDLSKNFEIGAHTMTHPLLSRVDDMVARREIAASKKTLEDILGSSVNSFCYPGGDYGLQHIRMVKDAGFLLARTTKRFSVAVGNNLFELPTTLHCYRHWSDATPIFREIGISHFTRDYLHWDELAIDMFDKVRLSGGVFHLWGHSWELERNGDWDRLERLLQYISGNPGVDYVTNRELV